MKIQKLTPEYFQECFALINSNFEHKIKIHYLEDSMINSQSATYIMINEENNEAVATVGIRELNRVCWLASKYKRFGYARRLMNYLINEHKDIYLFVKQSNIPAIELYKSLDFMVVGTKELSFKMEI